MTDTSHKGLEALAAYIMELRDAGVAGPRPDGNLDLQPILQRVLDDMKRISDLGAHYKAIAGMEVKQ